MLAELSGEAALNLVAENFSNFSVRSECPPVKITPEPTIVAIRRQELHLPRIQQARLLMAWVCPGAEDLETAIALDLIALILVGGRSSGLFRELREERQLVMDIDCSLSMQKDSSMFLISAWLATEDLKMVEQIICDRLNILHRNLISLVEIQRAQRQLINDYIFSSETPSQLANIYGFYDIVATAAHVCALSANCQSATARTIANNYPSLFVPPNVMGLRLSTLLPE